MLTIVVTTMTPDLAVANFLTGRPIAWLYYKPVAVAAANVEARKLIEKHFPASIQKEPEE